MYRGWLGALLILLTPTAARCRVFQLTDLTVAPYVRGTFGDSWLHQEGFIHGNGDVAIKKTSTLSYSGELGLLVSLANSLNLRIGAEILQPNSVSNAEGLNSSGTKVYTLNSDLFAFNPGLSLEYAYKMMPTNRLLFNLGVGYGVVSLENKYKMTPAGVYQFGITDFTESAQAVTTTYSIGCGWEFYFVDQTTIMIETGYRYFKINHFQHTSSQRTIAEPAGASTGDTLLNEDGCGRKVDLSSAFVGLSIRVYIF